MCAYDFFFVLWVLLRVWLQWWVSVAGSMRMFVEWSSVDACRVKVCVGNSLMVVLCVCIVCCSL